MLQIAGCPLKGNSCSHPTPHHIRLGARGGGQRREVRQFAVLCYYRHSALAPRAMLLWCFICSEHFISPIYIGRSGGLEGHKPSLTSSKAGFKRLHCLNRGQCRLQINWSLPQFGLATYFNEAQNKLPIHSPIFNRWSAMTHLKEPGP